MRKSEGTTSGEGSPPAAAGATDVAGDALARVAADVVATPRDALAALLPATLAPVAGAAAGIFPARLSGGTVSVVGGRARVAASACASVDLPNSATPSPQTSASSKSSSASSPSDLRRDGGIERAGHGPRHFVVVQVELQFVFGRSFRFGQRLGQRRRQRRDRRAEVRVGQFLALDDAAQEGRQSAQRIGRILQAEPGTAFAQP